MSNLGANAATAVDKQVTISDDGSARVTYEMPAGVSFTPPATEGGLPLRSYDVRTRKGKTTVTVLYTSPESQRFRITAPPGTVTRSSDGTAQELPIETHPDYSAGQSEAEGVPVVNGNLKPGVQSYLVPGIAYTRTEVKSAFTFSQANLTASVGKRNAPAGLSGPTAGRWLKTAIRVDQAGGVVNVSETWQYAPQGWDEDIYPD